MRKGQEAWLRERARDWIEHPRIASQAVLQPLSILVATPQNPALTLLEFGVSLLQKTAHQSGCQSTLRSDGAASDDPTPQSPALFMLPCLHSLIVGVAAVCRCETVFRLIFSDFQQSFFRGVVRRLCLASYSHEGLAPGIEFVVLSLPRWPIFCWEEPSMDQCQSRGKLLTTFSAVGPYTDLP